MDNQTQLLTVESVNHLVTLQTREFENIRDQSLYGGKLKGLLGVSQLTHFPKLIYMSSLGLGLFSMKEALGSAHCDGLVNHMASGEMKPFESLGPILLSKEEKHFRRFHNLLKC